MFFPEFTTPLITDTQRRILMKILMALNGGDGSGGGGGGGTGITSSGDGVPASDPSNVAVSQFYFDKTNNQLYIWNPEQLGWVMYPGSP